VATKYLDHVGGNDSNDGSSFALRVKTFASGFTAARIAPGDLCKVMQSPDPTLVDSSASWTQYSKTITLSGAVTTNITDCETAWTASANVTATADTVQFKENTKSAKLVIATGFTTGLVAYFATGTLDLSTKKQVSFWVKNSAALSASTLSIRLCSDTAGVTTVNTIAIPALPGSTWVPITVDTGSALGSAIQSVALYADLDPGTQTIFLDNIIACKDSTSADSLSLTSLIGKVHNLSWVASTTYAANVIRRPTQPNRNGFCYKVTAGGGGAAGSSEPTWPLEIGATVTDGALTWTCLELEDTWYPIQSINGVTVKIDNGNDTLANAGRGYDGTTESVATYKREPINLTMIAAAATGHNQPQDSGTPTSNITFSGGWNTTDMTTQTGETWLSGQNGYGATLTTNTDITVNNINSTRTYYGVYYNAGGRVTLNYCHFVGCYSYAAYIINNLPFVFNGVIGNNSAGMGIELSVNLSKSCKIIRSSFSNNITYGIDISGCSPGFDVNHIRLRNNSYGVVLAANSEGPLSIRNLVTGGNTNAAVYNLISNTYLFNSLIPESTEFQTPNTWLDAYYYSMKHDQTADNHLITTDGGTIISATDRRDVASGISWKFRPTSTNRSIAYPLKLKIASVAVNANAQVTMSIKSSIDHANIKGNLVVPGGQIAGVPSDVSVPLTTTVDADFHVSSDLLFTPTEKGVVDVYAHVWDGVGTTNALWTDTFAVSQV